jgi:hypothetical protein
MKQIQSTSTMTLPDGRVSVNIRISEDGSTVGKVAVTVADVGAAAILIGEVAAQLDEHPKYVSNGG